MKKQLYFVEVGVLLKPNDKEFDYYHINGFYDDEFGFYDENRLTFLSYDEARKYADYYIEKGIEGTYSFIHSNVCNITDEELEEIQTSLYCECCLENPNKEDVLYFAYKECGKLFPRLS